MYELFILGLLLDGPMHGYLLHQIVNKAIGPVRQMGWGALYPMIRRLEAAGLITPEGPAEPEQGGGRHRKIYRITEAGRTRFHGLMLREEEYSTDETDLFTMKFCNFAHIGLQEQLLILDRYDGFLRFQREHLLARRQHLQEGLEQRRHEARRPYVVATIERRLLVLDADRRWVAAQIAATESLIAPDPSPVQDHPAADRRPLQA